MHLCCSAVRGVVLSLLWAVSLSAAQKSWTLEGIMNVKAVSDPQITADGSRVTYVVTERDAYRNGYSSEILIGAATRNPPRRPASPVFSDAHRRWSGDGGRLAFLCRWGVGGISEPMHQREVMRRNLEWFEKWILGR